jgi:Ca2+-transporting ATPase
MSFEPQKNGLSTEEAAKRLTADGPNAIAQKKESRLWNAVKGVFTEPMVLLLLVSALLYALHGDYPDALFLAGSILVVAAISIYQEAKSRIALEKLQSYTSPHAVAMRSGELISVPTSSLVCGDLVLLEEGMPVPADALLREANDFSVDESILTGESMAVFKYAQPANDKVFQGTMVATGRAWAEVIATGGRTELGKIGKSIVDLDEPPTPLEKQVNAFVRAMVFVGAGVFALVWLVNVLMGASMYDALLRALTLAMSILPEEIPVAFTTFMALGAFRLMSRGVVVKRMKTVETLGSATVICTDKTGTLTENRMSLAALISSEASAKHFSTDQLVASDVELLEYAMFSSEPEPFDPMEKALHEAYTNCIANDQRKHFKLVHEYPLGGKPPLMTHVFQNASGERIIAAKGAPEGLLKNAKLSESDTEYWFGRLHELTSQGYRVLGVGKCEWEDADFPQNQTDFSVQFLGLVAFYDAPKANVSGVLSVFEEAGIAVKMITGDNKQTAMAIGKEVGLRSYEAAMDGDELMQLSEEELREKVKTTFVFSRMYPEAKLRIVKALQANGEVVAMTGDGVNDGPALKAADIGIAMGKRGSEIARQAAALVLTDDDFSRMVEAVAMGRRIYANLKRAIQYIISIHIPIILLVLLPLLLGWVYPAIFTPVHIIFLELIMGPTCSLIYENEPMEANTMRQVPRAPSVTFFNWRELSTSILQGCVIALGASVVYFIALAMHPTLETVRTAVFVSMITSNVGLTLVNRSFYYSLIQTMWYKNRLMPYMIGGTLLLTALMLFWNPLREFFGFEVLSVPLYAMASGVGLLSAVWFEVVKWYRRQSAEG